MKLSPELRYVLDFLAREADLPGGQAVRTNERFAIRTLNPDRLAALLAENHLLPFIAARCRFDDTHPMIRVVPRDELLLSYYQSGRQAVLRTSVLRKALALLDNSVSCVVLKGAAVAPILYREAAERPMRDIDLLVACADDQHLAKDLLARAGFSVSVAAPGHHHLPPLYDPGGQISIELHVNLFTPPLSADFMAALWQRRVTHASSFRFQTLDPVGMFLHHALHAFSNPVDAPLVRDVLEVACLAARLTEEQQREARELAALSGRDTVIARSARMAHELFGAPLFMSAPPRGPYEWWCYHRLEWTEPKTPVERLTRHFARERFDSLCSNPHRENTWPWIQKCAAGLARRAGQTLRGMRFCWEQRVQRAPHPFVQVGANTLVHNPRSGEVHMLNEAGSAVWKAASSPVSKNVLLRLSEVGTMQEGRAALRELMRHGLLERLSGNAEHVASQKRPG